MMVARKNPESPILGQISRAILESYI